MPCFHFSSTTSTSTRNGSTVQHRTLQPAAAQASPLLAPPPPTLRQTLVSSPLFFVCAHTDRCTILGFTRLRHAQQIPTRTPTPPPRLSPTPTVPPCSRSPIRPITSHCSTTMMSTSPILNSVSTTLLPARFCSLLYVVYYSATKIQRYLQEKQAAAPQASIHFHSLVSSWCYRCHQGSIVMPTCHVLHMYCICLLPFENKTYLFWNIIWGWCIIDLIGHLFALLSDWT